jgi:hypothetical protein
MAINPVRIDYLTASGFIHSQNKFCVCNLAKLSIAENLFSAGLTNTNTLKTYKLQHWYDGELPAVYLRLFDGNFKKNC